MTFTDDLTRGLRLQPKTTPCKYFYDDRGAQLFDQICRLPVYYPTHAELSILRRYGKDIADAIGEGADVIELGSGAALKTRLLLSALDGVGLYIPVDLACDQLQTTAAELRREYPDLSVSPVCADFTADFELPAGYQPARTLVFFPGSTLGNFDPVEATALLRRVRELCSTQGAALIGIDLKKDPATLHRAYNDDNGVTAAFNLNLLTRANRELGADFEIARFRHYAYYNPNAGRIEMTLVSMARQQVRLAGERFGFELGEPITTEHSYKYDLGQFAELAGGAGLSARQAWLDGSGYFALVHLTPR